MEYTTSSLLNQANMEVGKNLTKQWQLIDEERLYFRELHKPGRYKIKMKIKKTFRNKKQDAFQHEEGVFKISQNEGVFISIPLEI